MSTATPTEVPTEQPSAVTAVAEQTPQNALFRWNAWLHVGEGATDCPDKQNGECSNGEHFHAWCRLPNPWQVRDITDKATAAQARYAKLLRDPDSDPSVVLEDDLSTLYNQPKEMLVEELVDRHWPEDYAEAVKAVDAIEGDADEDVEDDEDDEAVPPSLKWANIDQDREEYLRQSQLPEEKRTEDFAVMEANVAAYGKAVEEEMERIQKPRRIALMESEPEALVQQIRRIRVEHKTTEVYLHWFNTWQWFACTFKPAKGGKTPSERVWGDIQHMKQHAPPEVVHGLRAVFDGLESNLAASRLGKGS